jgi:hypothetical protein
VGNSFLEPKITPKKFHGIPFNIDLYEEAELLDELVQISSIPITTTTVVS